MQNCAQYETVKRCDGNVVQQVFLICVMRKPPPYVPAEYVNRPLEISDRAQRYNAFLTREHGHTVSHVVKEQIRRSREFQKNVIKVRRSIGALQQRIREIQQVQQVRRPPSKLIVK